MDAALGRVGASSDPFAAIVCSTRMPVVITNPREADNPIAFVNDAFCNLTGYSREESIGRNCRFLQGPETEPAKVALMRAAARSGKPLDLEVRNYRKDGTPFWNRLHMVPLHDASGDLIYFFASQLDVTGELDRLQFLERHNADLLTEKDARHQADAANAEKSRFLAVASHDIRQPLQSLVLLQGILARTIQGDPAERLVLRLGQTLESMSSMLNSLLDLNQVEAGAVRTNITEFSINDILDRLKDGFVYDAQAKGVLLRVVPCSLFVKSDRRLLEQMIRNLLANAIKYSPEGKVLVGCRRNGTALSLEVWDTGIGIPENAVETIFREYHQLDTQEGRSTRGLGLGLSIVHRFGNLLGHRIRVRSEVGKGSVFAIELLQAADSAPSASPVVRQFKGRGSPPLAEASSILLIEDDLETGEILQNLLGDEGYRVVLAHNGLEALELIEVEGMRPDIFVTDSKHETSRSGPEIATRLQGHLSAEIPVIILSGDASTHAAHGTGSQNAVRLTKPVKLRELTAAIQRSLSVSRSSRAASAPPKKGTDLSLNEATIFVIDDNRDVIDAMGSVIESAGGVVQAYASSEAFCAVYRPGRNSCLLLDAYLPGMSGLALLQKLREDGDVVPVIMITGASDVAMAVQAMKAGASDFIEKPVGGSDLIASLRNALTHMHSSEDLADRREKAASLVADLTVRQREIMAMVLAGHPSKNIAVDLGISQRTVENHRASIMRKTNTKSLPALARLALAANWDEQYVT
ncbi:response regulator (plasmid) [Lichenicola cladoniae]|uniref:histidine kinase n=1 Tax=Lichenicola cladoniae TaxID=1484109 RepID=A0A6M8HY45_9PROT|nr:response regulator [Lichenicola cladoniae]NPD66810.1 response regulator [Acetobacteraceae bacterium]QKE93494.1 response regulator [Lichenicola cladoniae]